MSVSWSDVVAIAAELSTVPTATQDVILAAVDRQIDDVAWGDQANDGRRYLAAHMGMVYNGQDGAVVSQTLGPMAVSYASPMDDDALKTSRYGRFYLSMLKMLPTSLGLVP